MDVRVDDADGEALLGERDSQVDGDAALADPALSGGDGEDPGAGVGPGEGDLLLLLTAAQLLLQRVALLGAHHVELDGHGHHAGQRPDRGGDVLGEGGLHRAAGDREVQRDVDVPVGAHRDVLHHAQLGDGAADLGVVDGGEGVPDGVGARQCAHKVQGRSPLRLSAADPPGAGRARPGSGTRGTPARRRRGRACTPDSRRCPARWRTTGRTPCRSRRDARTPGSRAGPTCGRSSSPAAPPRRWSCRPSP